MSEAQAVIGAAAAEDRIAVASNWKLVWWRFRRHRLALFSAGLLICMYIVVLCPDFFSTQDPERTDARQAFIPVQMLHLFDDGWNPWVPAIVGKRDPRKPIDLRLKPATSPVIQLSDAAGRPVAGARVRELGLRGANGQCFMEQLDLKTVGVELPPSSYTATYWTLIVAVVEVAEVGAVQSHSPSG